MISPNSQGLLAAHLTPHQVQSAGPPHDEKRSHDRDIATAGMGTIANTNASTRTNVTSFFMAWFTSSHKFGG